MFKRVTNIINIEQQKEPKVFDGIVESSKFLKNEEKELYEAMMDASVNINNLRLKKLFKEELEAYNLILIPIDNFFEKLMINDLNYEIRKNRLNILFNLMQLTKDSVDFSQIEN